jgi:hypothetical protein
MTAKKPEGIDKFQELLGKLSQVPKKELDSQVAKAKKRAVKRKK